MTNKDTDEYRFKVRRATQPSINQSHGSSVQPALRATPAPGRIPNRYNAATRPPSQSQPTTQHTPEPPAQTTPANTSHHQPIQPTSLQEAPSQNTTATIDGNTPTVSSAKRFVTKLTTLLSAFKVRTIQALISIKQFYRQHFFPSLGGLLAAIALVPFLAVGIQAASAELIPNANITNDWPTIVGSSGCTGACGAVNDGSSPDTNSYIATDQTNNTRTVEFGLTTVSNIEEATQIRLRVFANTVAQGSGADTLTLNVRIGGTLQGGTTLTPTGGSYGWLEYTLNGSWTQAQIDSLQARIVRNVVGGGNPAGRADEIRVASVYVDLTYTSAVELEQSSYRWFENENASDPSDEYLKLEDPDDTPPNNAFGTTFSNSGEFMAVTHEVTPFITIYEVDPGTDTFSKIPDTNIDTLPDGVSFDVKFSPDDSLMVVGHQFSPFMTVYEVDSSAGTFSKIPDTNIDTLPTGIVRSLDFSPDGSYLATGHHVSPFISVYEVDYGSVEFSRLGNPSTPPENIAYGAAFHPSGDYIAYAHADTSYVSVYELDSSTNNLTLVSPANFSELPPEVGFSVGFSPDGQYMAVGSGVSQFVTIYSVDISSETFTKIDDPDPLPPFNGTGVAFSTNGKYLIVSHFDSPYFTMYEIDNLTDTFTKLDIFDSNDLPEDNGYGVAFSPDDSYFVIAHAGDPYISIFFNLRIAEIGASLASQDAPVEAPAEGTPFRLRASLSADLGELGPGTNFKLQYAELGPGAFCSLNFSEGEAYSDVYPIGGEYDATDWKEETADAPWLARRFHTTIVYDNKLWLMGGIGEGTTRYNDVWYTEDGENWTQATANAGWDPRNQHTTVVYDGKMWVMGGVNSTTIFNDVWSSTDGITWNQETAAAAWDPNYGHRTLVYDNKMWHIGGFDDITYLREVWSSTDGISWNLETSTADWTGRSNHGAVVYDDKMWVIGGGTGSGGFDDSWYSTNGINWTEASASASWSARNNFGIAVVNEVIYIYGGFSGSYHNDIWSTTDGVTWNQEASSSPWSLRNGHQATLYNNNVYISGGSSNGTNRLNDVWSSSIKSSVINYHNNPSIPNGAGISASVDDPAPAGLGSPVLQSYVESNPFTNPNTIPDGDYGIWDFALVDNGAPTEATYCFRIVLDSGDELQMYSVIPELSIPPPALTQADYRWYRSAQPLIWSPAIGWINLGAGGSTGARVYDTHLEGYAWSENADWIRLGTHTGGGSHTYANTNETNYGVNRDPATGDLSGFAWSPTAGWINFDPSFGGVNYNLSNEAYSGFAWGETFGWISTDNARGNFLIDETQPIASEYTPPVSGPVAAQNTRAVVQQRNQPIRLRLALGVSGKNFTTDLSTEYKVQYALGLGDSCPVDFTGQTYQDIDGSTTSVRFMSNIGATDGGGIVPDSNDLTGILSLVNQTYHQSNPLSFSGGNNAPAGSTMLIDFSFDDATEGAGLYCFRIVNSNGTLINGYERIAELFTPPNNPQFLRHRRFFDDSGGGRPFFW